MHGVRWEPPRRHGTAETSPARVSGQSASGSKAHRRRRPTPNGSTNWSHVGQRSAREDSTSVVIDQSMRSARDNCGSSVAEGLPQHSSR